MDVVKKPVKILAPTSTARLGRPQAALLIKAWRAVHFRVHITRRDAVTVYYCVAADSSVVIGV